MDEKKSLPNTARTRQEDIVAFLCAKLASFGIHAVLPESPATKLLGHVECDDVGLVITTSSAAYDVLKSFLDASFSPPLFASGDTGTLIYRNDSCFTTVMLAHQDANTVLAVLHWRTIEVRDKIVAAQEAAIREILEAQSQ